MCISACDGAIISVGLSQSLVAGTHPASSLLLRASEQPRGILGGGRASCRRISDSPSSPGHARNGTAGARPRSTARCVRHLVVPARAKPQPICEPNGCSGMCCLLLPHARRSDRSVAAAAESDSRRTRVGATSVAASSAPRRNNRRALILASCSQRPRRCPWQLVFFFEKVLCLPRLRNGSKGQRACPSGPGRTTKQKTRRRRPMTGRRSAACVLPRSYVLLPLCPWLRPLLLAAGGF